MALKTGELTIHVYEFIFLLQRKPNEFICLWRGSSFLSHILIPALILSSVKESNISNNGITQDIVLSASPKGMYMVEVKDAQSVYVSKVVLQ